MLTALVLFGAAVACAAFLVLRHARRGALWWSGLVGSTTVRELESHFVFIPGARLLAATLLFAAGVVALALAMQVPLPAIVALGVAALAGPRIGLWWIRRKWRRALVRQLPDALALWSGLLRAGHGVQQALGQLAQRQSAPLGSELRFIQGQVRMGLALEEAFASLQERSGLADLRLLTTLLATQRELGGNLAESLQRLAQLLRSRLMMEERIASLTAQGRLQGVVVGVLPLLLMAALYFMEPEAMRVLHTTWQGWAALTLIAILELAGFLMIRRIVSIEI